jgi:hypothetical protein
VVLKWGGLQEVYTKVCNLRELKDEKRPPAIVPITIIYGLNDFLNNSINNKLILYLEVVTFKKN